MLNNGMEDTVVYYTVEEFAAGFKKTLAFQTCVCKQNSGSSGEDTLEVCASRTPPSRTEARHARAAASSNCKLATTAPRLT